MRIHERHRDFGLLERVHQIEGRVAGDNDILTVHTHTHLNRWVTDQREVASYSHIGTSVSTRVSRKRTGNARNIQIQTDIG